MIVQEASALGEELAALTCRAPGPGSLRLLRRRHRSSDVARLAEGGLGDRLSGRRVLDRKGAARRRRGGGPVDQHLVGKLAREESGGRGRAASGLALMGVSSARGRARWRMVARSASRSGAGSRVLGSAKAVILSGLPASCSAPGLGAGDHRPACCAPRPGDGKRLGDVVDRAARHAAHGGA